MQQVDYFIKRKNLIQKGSTILVAVSGGPDSVALLHYLVKNRRQWEAEVIALTVDHQLRAEAGEEAAYVESLCARLKVPCVRTKIDVAAYQEREGLGTQVAARELRYRFFEEQMEKYQADYLAFGHHGDDQIETILMAFTKTTSPGVLSGIPLRRPFARGEIIRPFLCVTKAEIMAYCERHQLQPKFDPSNEETTYTRNYYRKEIVPLFKAENENLAQTVQYLAEALQADEGYLMERAELAFKSLVKPDENKAGLCFDRRDFLKQPIALQRRIYHLILNYLYDERPEQLTHTHAENFFALLAGREGSLQIHFPHRLFVERVYDEIHLYFQDHAPQDSLDPQLLKVPGEVTFPDGSVLQANYVSGERTSDSRTHFVALGEDALPLYVRGRRAGDRMTWPGLKGRKKLKDIFIDEKIPQGKRDTWPIVTTKNDEILWLVGIRKGHVQKDEAKDKQIVQLTFIEGERR